MSAQIIIAPSQAAAISFASRAHAWRQANIPGYSATKWGDPFQHPTNGTWAIDYRADMAAAFTAGELAGVQDWSADWRAPDNGDFP